MTWQHHPQFQSQIPPSPLLNHSGENSSDDHANGELSPNFLLQFLKGGVVDEARNDGEVHRHQVQPVQDWQLQDPAVAALGPSHSFPLPPGEVPPPGIYSPMPPPVPAPPPLQYGGGWSPLHQQERLFPENPFLTPTDHGFIRPFALQVERPFHPHGPLPFPYPIERDGIRQMHEQHHGFGASSTPPLFGPAVMDLTDNKRVLEQQQWQITQSTVEGVLKDEKKGGQQFFGTGAELLQLLQGGPARAKTATVKAEGVTENGENSLRTPQRGSPSTVHGPIGPPRRQVASPPQSPNDLLGRMWASLPTSTQVQYVEHDAVVLDESDDRVLDARFFDEGYRYCQESEGHQGTGFSLLKRGGTSKLPLNGFECQDSKVTEKQKSYSSSSSTSTPGRSPEYHRGRRVNGEHEFGEENRVNGKRRGSVPRRIGGRGVVGQWVAVNEKNKETDTCESSSIDMGDTKDEIPKANGFHRDELKRKKKLQQEWRVKGPQVDSKVNSLSDKKDFRPKARPLASQLEHPGLPCGSTQGSAVGAALDESKQRLYNRLDPDGLDDEEVTSYVASLDLDDQENDYVQRDEKPEFHKPRELRCRESRRHIYVHRRDLFYRPDLQKFTLQLLILYNELIPTEEEEARRRKCLSKLEALVERELPGARLFLFGSCANAFGVRNSDIDICLNVEEEEPNKVELVMKIAAILEADNMLNVQALTHARVPIVKFTEPETGISCDICVNNMLAVVNSKLLHDYAQIDERLRQLAFMVKHWAKRRQVNETYRGTLSSYAYVLMCIHFLQQRRPPVLPCLQEMPPTYEVKVGHIRCSYFDHVEKLSDFGAENKETLGELLTAFFDYWAYRHNYNHAVVSVRTGGYLSKDEKEWTRRIGNERHLICIEDPFETSHDLGRVVDKHSIKALRGEFYRAANTIASELNPCNTLFEPYIRQQQQHKPSSTEDK